jgi:hypothetical protein
VPSLDSDDQQAGGRLLVSRWVQSHSSLLCSKKRRGWPEGDVGDPVGWRGQGRIAGDLVVRIRKDGSRGTLSIPNLMSQSPCRARDQHK